MKTLLLNLHATRKLGDVLLAHLCCLEFGLGAKAFGNKCLYKNNWHLFIKSQK